MTRVALLMLLAFTPLGSCRQDHVVGPGSDDASRPVRPPLARISVTPEALVLFHGYDEVLDVRAWDAFGKPAPAFVTYSTSDSAIVAVHPWGQLHGRSPGRATITVTVRLGGVTLESRVEVQVVHLADDAANIIVAGTRGWSPSAIHVAPGSLVTWFALPDRRGGFSPERLTLLDTANAVIGSVDLKVGSATYRVGGPGTLRYCSGACWDPSEFGVIEIW